LMGGHRGDALEPEEAAVQVSTGAASEAAMSKSMEQGCKDSPEPEFATSPGGKVPG